MLLILEPVYGLGSESGPMIAWGALSGRRLTMGMPQGWVKGWLSQQAGMWSGQVIA